MKPELCRKTLYRSPVCCFVTAAGKNFQPNSVELESLQTEHPLQWYGKDSPAFAIFRDETAAQENSHGRRSPDFAENATAYLEVAPDLGCLDLWPWVVANRLDNPAQYVRLRMFLRTER